MMGAGWGGGQPPEKGKVPRGEQSREATERGRVSEISLWLGGFGAAAAWSVHLLFSVAFGAGSCVEAAEPLQRYSTPWWVLAGVTVVLLAGALWSTLVSVRNLHRLGVGIRQTSQALEQPGARPVFMSFSGLLLGAMFLVALGFSTLTLFLVPLCR
jgi:hypothetical protein